MHLAPEILTEMSLINSNLPLNVFFQINSDNKSFVWTLGVILFYLIFEFYPYHFTEISI